MVWKRKIKELTKEEALSIAREEAIPFWLYSKPLFAGVENEGKWLLTPLQENFTKGTFTIFVVDPFSFAGEFAIKLMKEWSVRYQNLGVQNILVFRSKIEDFSKADPVQAYLLWLEIKNITAIDSNGAISQALGKGQLPCFAFIRNGSANFISSGANFALHAEAEIQQSLRLESSGLPLLIPMNEDRLRCPIQDINQSTSHEVIYTGEWTRSGNAQITHDPKATIRFVSPASIVSMVARTPGRTVNATKVIVKIKDLAVFNAFAGADLQFDEEGKSYVAISGLLRLYHLLSGLPKTERLVELSFPNAKRSPVAIYGLHFGEQS